MLKELIKVKEVVRQLLTDEPATRDDDRLLLLKVWKRQNASIMRADYTFLHFAEAFRNKEFVFPESVRRQRAALQREFPELRGNNYRGQLAEGEVVREYYSPNYNEADAPEPIQGEIFGKEAE